MRALLLLLFLTGCSTPYFHDAGTAPEPRRFSLETWPHRELWTGVVFNGEKVGFTRRQVRAAGDLWEVESEAVMRLQFLGVDKRIRLRSLDRVRSDLTLEAFSYEHEIDGSQLFVSGHVKASVLSYSVKARGSTEQRELPLAGPVYPTSALAFLPLKDLKLGASRRYDVFHGETQSITQAEQQVLGFESSRLFEGSAFKVETKLLGLDTTTWIAADGRPVFELGLRGVIISALEEEAAARRYLVEASLNKRDAMVDFSLIRAGPIEAPRSVSRMEIVLSGLPPAFNPANPACSRESDRLVCSIDSLQHFGGDPKKHLAPTLAAPSTLHEIADLARTIVGDAAGDAASDEERISRLLAWMDANIAKEAIDAFTASDVLRARRAECQGHAYLFAAFARALGIPTRIVNGIAYSAEHGGFLYHTWNEAWIGGRGWRPVDATFGQARADATHVKLIEGESAAELLPLVGLVGRLRVETVAALSRW